MKYFLGLVSEQIQSYEEYDTGGGEVAQQGNFMHKKSTGHFEY